MEYTKKPRIPPIVFNNKSSTSKLPTFVNNCITSTQKLYSKQRMVVKKIFLHLESKDGKNMPIGIKTQTFPQTFNTNNLQLPVRIPK